MPCLLARVRDIEANREITAQRGGSQIQGTVQFNGQLTLIARQRQTLVGQQGDGFVGRIPVDDRGGPVQKQRAAHDLRIDGEPRIIEIGQIIAANRRFFDRGHRRDPAATRAAEFSRKDDNRIRVRQFRADPRRANVGGQTSAAKDQLLNLNSAAIAQRHGPRICTRAAFNKHLSA